MPSPKVYSNPETTLGWLVLMLLMFFGHLADAQQKEIVPDLSKIQQADIWTLRGRQAAYQNGEVHLNAIPGDGILLLKDVKFSNGTISLDIKGKNDPGKSFVGVAFHAVNDSTYDAIYFRPFNFKNPDRKNHAVQYISHPAYPWDKLRSSHPGKYENAISPVVDPNEWFHVTLVVEHPTVKVFVNGAKVSTLEISQLSVNKSGLVGFWVGNNSEGYFRNLKITPAR